MHVAGWRPKWLFSCIQVVLLNHILSVFKLLHTELANKHPADRPKSFIGCSCLYIQAADVFEDAKIISCTY